MENKQLAIYREGDTNIQDTVNNDTGNLTRAEKLEALRILMQADTEMRFIKDGYDWQIHFSQYQVTIKEGKKYTKIDRGTSGVYMVDQDGQIWGIKAYGVIHRGYFYGTLDTINDYNWGDYTARKIK